MTRFCQMRIIQDGIRINQQPPQDDCCNLPAQNGPGCYADHVSLRGLLHYEGEGLDANGEAL